MAHSAKAFQIWESVAGQCAHGIQLTCFLSQVACSFPNAWSSCAARSTTTCQRCSRSSSRSSSRAVHLRMCVCVCVCVWILTTHSRERERTSAERVGKHRVERGDSYLVLYEERRMRSGTNSINFQDHIGLQTDFGPEIKALFSKIDTFFSKSRVVFEKRSLKKRSDFLDLERKRGETLSVKRRRKHTVSNTPKATAEVEALLAEGAEHVHALYSFRSVGRVSRRDFPTTCFGILFRRACSSRDPAVSRRGIFGPTTHTSNAQSAVRGSESRISRAENRRRMIYIRPPFTKRRGRLKFGHIYHREIPVSVCTIVRERRRDLGVSGAPLRT